MFRPDAEYCAECGKPIHYSVECKESQFFLYSKFIDDPDVPLINDPEDVITFVEEIDKYSLNLATSWYGLDVVLKGD